MNKVAARFVGFRMIAAFVVAVLVVLASAGVACAKPSDVQNGPRADVPSGNRLGGSPAPNLLRVLILIASPTRGPGRTVREAGRAVAVSADHRSIIVGCMRSALLGAFPVGLAGSHYRLKKEARFS